MGIECVLKINEHRLGASVSSHDLQSHIQRQIRQQLQVLRDKGLPEFLGAGDTGSWIRGGRNYGAEVLILGAEVAVARCRGGPG